LYQHLSKDDNKKLQTFTDAEKRRNTILKRQGKDAELVQLLRPNGEATQLR